MIDDIDELTRLVLNTAGRKEAIALYAEETGCSDAEAMQAVDRLREPGRASRRACLARPFGVLAGLIVAGGALAFLLTLMNALERSAHEKPRPSDTSLHPVCGNPAVSTLSATPISPICLGAAPCGIVRQCGTALTLDPAGGAGDARPRPRNTTTPDAAAGHTGPFDAPAADAARSALQRDLLLRSHRGRSGPGPGVDLHPLDRVTDKCSGSFAV